jgi:hypothetical protein
MPKQELLHTVVYPLLFLVICFVVLKRGKFIGGSKKKDGISDGNE